MSLLVTGLEAAACVSQYSPAELRQGIDLRVDDPEDLVESATLIAFYELPGSTQISRIGDRGSIVLDPGLRGYEVIVAYRTGPYCAVVPSVAVHGTEDAIVVEVASHQRGGCDDMQYDEAIGFNFATARAGQPIVIEHRH